MFVIVFGSEQRWDSKKYTELNLCMFIHTVHTGVSYEESSQNILTALPFFLRSCQCLSAIPPPHRSAGRSDLCLICSFSEALLAR